MTEIIMLAGRLYQKWLPLIPTLIGVRVGTAPTGNGQAVYVRTRGKGFPRGLPPSITINVGVTQITLPVLWKGVVEPPPVQRATAKQNLPLHRSMWDGAPDIRDRMMPTFKPNDHRLPWGTMGEVPPVTTQDFQAFFPVRDPRLPFWSKPFDLRQCICIDQLGVEKLVLQYEIPSDQMLTLTGMSYNTFGSAVSDRLRFSVGRSGDQQAQFDDMVMANAPDDAHQFAFSGHEQPMPMNVIIDHDQTLTVHVTALGGPPYIPTPGTPTDIQVCVTMRGWLSTLNDRRDGAPKTYDIGAITEESLGDRDLVGEFTDRDLAVAVQRLVDATADNGGVPA